MDGSQQSEFSIKAERHKELATQIESLSESNEKLQSELQVAKFEITTLKKGLSKEKEFLKGLNSYVESATEEYKKLEAQKCQLECSLSTQTNEFKEEKKKMKELEKNAEVLTSELETLKSLQAKNSLPTDEDVRFKRKQEADDSMIMILKQELESYKAENLSLTEKQFKTQSLIDAYSTLKKKYDSLNRKYSSLLHSIDSHHDRGVTRASSPDSKDGSEYGANLDRDGSPQKDLAAELESHFKSESIDLSRSDLFELPSLSQESVKCEPQNEGNLNESSLSNDDEDNTATHDTFISEMKQEWLMAENKLKREIAEQKNIIHQNEIEIEDLKRQLKLARENESKVEGSKEKHLDENIELDVHRKIDEKVLRDDHSPSLTCSSKNSTWLTGPSSLPDTNTRDLDDYLFTDFGSKKNTDQKATFTPPSTVKSSLLPSKVEAVASDLVSYPILTGPRPWMWLILFIFVGEIIFLTYIWIERQIWLAYYQHPFSSISRGYSYGWTYTLFSPEVANRVEILMTRGAEYMGFQIKHFPMPS